MPTHPPRRWAHDEDLISQGRGSKFHRNGRKSRFSRRSHRPMQRTVLSSRRCSATPAAGTHPDCRRRSPMKKRIVSDPPPRATRASTCGASTTADSSSTTPVTSPSGCALRDQRQAHPEPAAVGGGDPRATRRSLRQARLGRPDRRARPRHEPGSRARARAEAAARPRLDRSGGAPAQRARPHAGGQWAVKHFAK